MLCHPEVQMRSICLEGRIGNEGRIGSSCLTKPGIIAVNRVASRRRDIARYPGSSA